VLAEPDVVLNLDLADTFWENTPHHCTNCIFHVSLQLLLEKFCAPIDIYLVALQMRTEMRVGLCVKCPLLFPEFNHNWCVLFHVSKLCNTKVHDKYDIYM
jgi:hypothetical protein